MTRRGLAGRGRWLRWDYLSRSRAATFGPVNVPVSPVPCTVEPCSVTGMVTGALTQSWLLPLANLRVTQSVAFVSFYDAMVLLGIPSISTLGH